MRFVLVLLAGTMLAGCELGTSPAATSDTVVRVNDDVITRVQWNAAVEELEQSTGADLDDTGRRKVLESLVQSRLMANAMATSLDSSRKAEIDARAELHRERLLVKEYLRRNADPAPVTEERVQAYYAQHPERFGATERRRFELLTTETAPGSAQRKAVLDAMETLRTQPEWRVPPSLENVRWVHRLEDAGNRALDKRMAVADRLAEGDTSETILIGGRPYLLRVTHVEKRVPKPLAEVRGDIQRRLQIEQLQQAVDRAGEKLLSEAKIEYLVPVAQNEE